MKTNPKPLDLEELVSLIKEKIDDEIFESPVDSEAGEILETPKELITRLTQIWKKEVTEIIKQQIKEACEFYLRYKDKIILDVACGPKHFWFDKNHLKVLYNDIRNEKKGFLRYRPNCKIEPDTNFNFKDLPFPDKCFKLVVFDPPHIISDGMKFNLTKQYGFLNKDTWKKDIKKGFDECWRVLDDFGVLIFKWNEVSIKKKEVLKVIQKNPLFGHSILSKIPTHWFCFMKIPEDTKNPKYNEWLFKLAFKGVLNDN